MSNKKNKKKIKRTINLPAAIGDILYDAVRMPEESFGLYIVAGVSVGITNAEDYEMRKFLHVDMETPVFTLCSLDGNNIDYVDANDIGRTLFVPNKENMDKIINTYLAPGKAPDNASEDDKAVIPTFAYELTEDIKAKLKTVSWMPIKKLPNRDRIYVVSYFLCNQEEDEIHVDLITKKVYDRAVKKGKFIEGWDKNNSDLWNSTPKSPEELEKHCALTKKFLNRRTDDKNR